MQGRGRGASLDAFFHKAGEQAGPDMSGPQRLLWVVPQVFIFGPDVEIIPLVPGFGVTQVLARPVTMEKL